ncbi:dihydroxyacetone kinase subunit DhaK, partial [Streptomyces sp. NPDC048258]
MSSVRTLVRGSPAGSTREVGMKMLINSPETVVADALRGLAAAHPELDVDVER